MIQIKFGYPLFIIRESGNFNEDGCGPLLTDAISEDLLPKTTFQNKYMKVFLTLQFLKWNKFVLIAKNAKATLMFDFIKIDFTRFYHNWKQTIILYEHPVWRQKTCRSKNKKAQPEIISQSWDASKNITLFQWSPWPLFSLYTPWKHWGLKWEHWPEIC